MRDTKQQLIRKGTKLFMHHSFQGTGINDVLKEAGVPKGSFYHFFPSKEDFALEVISSWVQRSAQVAEAAFRNSDLNYLERTISFFQNLLGAIKQGEFRYGCLLGTIGQEMAANSEQLRQAVESGFADTWTALAECIAQGQKTGDINQALDPQTTARFIFSAMQGSIILAKVEKSEQALTGFVDTIATLLKPRLSGK